MVRYLDNNSGFNQWNANREKTFAKSKFVNFLWWFVLFMASWWLITWWMEPQQGENANQTTVIETIDITNVPVQQIDDASIGFNVQGLRLSNIALKNYDISDTDKTPVKLLGGADNFAEIGFITNGVSVPDIKTVWNIDNAGKMYWRNPAGVEFTREIKTDGYLITITDSIKNPTKQNVNIAPYVRMVRDNDKSSSAGVATGAIAYVNSDIERVDWHKMDKRAYAYSTTNGFIGFADQYWQTVANISEPDQTMRAKMENGKYMTDVVSANISIASGETKNITSTIFAGPRDQKILDAASATIVGLDDTIDYGWFGFFARPMLWLLNAFNSVVMNYGIAIILMTIFLRLLIWPLTRKSYTSMIAMQKMQPEMVKIQKLYATDKARMQMEMMRLYQTHKTSPMSGCLPMLLQIPIFFALYKALLVSVQMRNASFLWISDLSVMDPYFILPILMGLTMWIQQRLQTPKKVSDDKNDVAAQTQKFMKWMPVIFTVMFAWMPAGLVLYWTISNIFGLVQLYIIKRINQ